MKKIRNFIAGAAFMIMVCALILFIGETMTAIERDVNNADIIIGALVTFLASGFLACRLDKNHDD